MDNESLLVFERRVHRLSLSIPAVSRYWEPNSGRGSSQLRGEEVLGRPVALRDIYSEGVSAIGSVSGQEKVEALNSSMNMWIVCRLLGNYRGNRLIDGRACNSA